MNLKEDLVEDFTQTYKSQTQELFQKKIRVRLFELITALFIFGPLLWEYSRFYFSGKVSGSLQSSVAMVVFSILNFIGYQRRKDLNFALNLMAFVQLFLYAWALVTSGGIYSEHLIIMPLGIVIVGYVFGKWASIWTALYLGLLCVLLLVFENFGIIPAPDHLPVVGILGYQAIAGLFFTALFVVLFELARNQIEEILIKTNQMLLKEKIEAQRNANLFHSIYDNAPIGIAQINEDLKLMSVNSSYCEFLGYSAVELKNKSVLDFVHPLDRELLILLAQQNASNENFKLNRHEKRYIHKSGKTIWGSVTVRAMKLEDDGEVTFFAVVEDITEKKQNEEIRSLMFETMSDGFVLQDSEGAIKQLNPAASALLGLTQDQLIGKTSLDPSWKASQADGSPFHGEDHPSMIALRTGKKVVGELMGFKLPSGQLRWIRVSATPFNLTCQSEREVVCTFSDVTDLIASQNENRFILDALQIGVWKFNPVDQSVVWDKSMYRLYDVDENDFTGDYQAWESILTPEAKDKATVELGQALRGEKDYDTIFEIQTKSRGKRMISGRGKVIRNEAGAPVMMYGVNVDVTDFHELQNQVEAERQKSIKNSKLASLGEMSAGIAHEINNPLAIISGSIALLSRNLSNPEKLSVQIQVIEKSCERISKIIKGLVKFSRSGEKAIHLPHSLSVILKEVVTLTDAKSKAQGVPVVLENRLKKCPLEAKISCDEVEIEQVLINLINNAIDAVNDRLEKWVNISIKRESSSVVLRIMDSGAGIPESVRNRIFEPFFTTKKVGEGTGLGLSITKGILDEHRATIAVVSDVPHTCFEVRFPAID